MLFRSLRPPPHRRTGSSSCHWLQNVVKRPTCEDGRFIALSSKNRHAHSMDFKTRLHFHPYSLDVSPGQSTILMLGVLPAQCVHSGTRNLASLWMLCRARPIVKDAQLAGKLAKVVQVGPVVGCGTPRQLQKHLGGVIDLLYLHQCLSSCCLQGLCNLGLGLT